MRAEGGGVLPVSLLHVVFTLLVFGSRTKSVSGLSAGNFRLSAVA